MTNITGSAFPEHPASQRHGATRADSAWLAATDASTQISLGNLRHALDQHAIVSIANASGMIISVNEKFCEISGYKIEELLGKNHRILKSAQHSDEFFSDMWATISSGNTWQGEIKNIKKNGGYYWVASTIVPFLDENGLPYQYISIRTDITEQKQLQESLAISEEIYRALVEQVPVGIFELDATGDCYYVNDRWCSIARLHPQQALGMGWMDAVHPQDQIRFADEWHRALSTGQEFQCECRFGAKAQPPRWVSVTARKQSDDTGNLTGHLGAVSDITAIKEHEVELLLAKLSAESASRAKSEFLSRMSHELRTPMNAILGFSQLLEADTVEPLSPAQIESNQQVLIAGRHLLELINDVLDLSRIETNSLVFKEEDALVRVFIEKAVALVTPQAQKMDIRLTMVEGGDHLIRTDLRRFMQVMLNLLSNAIKYNRAGGYVIVSWAPHEGNMLRISIQDSGHGIPACQIEHIFEPFNRLAYENSDIEGTGIGLAIASRLMTLLHGAIGVESIEGKGSTFWIDIPLT